MLSIGGFPIGNDHKPNTNSISPDPWTHGIGIFDMTDLSWSSSYDANAKPYEQSNVVKQYYQSNSGTPTWSDPALAAVFATNTSSKSLSSKPTATSTTPPQTSKHGTNVGAIAGGVVGGIAGVCAILFLAAFLLRRRRKPQEPAQPSFEAQMSNTKYTELSVEPSHHELGPTPAHEMGPSPAHELEINPAREKTREDRNHPSEKITQDDGYQQQWKSERQPLHWAREMKM